MQKVFAHSRLAEACNSLGRDVEALRHRRSMIEWCQKLNPANLSSEQVRDALAPVLRWWDTGTELLIGQNMELLQQAAGLLPNDPKLAIEQNLQKYSLIGQPAPVIEAPYWLNGGPDGGTMTFGGKPTLIQFTGALVRPCRKTYPTMLKLHARFQQRGLEIVLLTRLFTWFGQEQSLPTPRK